MAIDPKNIQLQRHEDGMASVLRKTTVYQTLYFYRKSDVLVQLTKTFCDRFLPKYGDRTVDQMVQAARSIKQNIAEGCTDGQTSVEVELKLLGIARGSNQELLEDYMDYLKHKHLSDWGKVAGKAEGEKEFGEPGDPRTASIEQRYDKMLRFCRNHNDNDDYQPYYDRWTDEEMANCAICICHMVDKAMCSYIAKKDREFVEQGGIRERMTAARLDHRGTQKEIIARQQQEIEQLRNQIASLQRELEAIKNKEA